MLDGPAVRWHAEEYVPPSTTGSIITTARPPLSTASAPSAGLQRRNVLVGFLFGCGIIAFVDEVVFHQLLNWHHFYDQSTRSAGLVSDGLFHAFSWFATVASLFLFADLRRRRALRPRLWAGGILLGMGTFQLYDGLVQHKVFGLHQIRYDVDLLPYDLAWNIAAVALLVVGALLVLIGSRGTGRSGRDTRGSGTGHG